MFFRSPDHQEHSTAAMLCCTVLGKMAAEYVGGLNAEVLSKSTEYLAVQMLEHIYHILEDQTRNDSSCLQCIEDIMSEYYRTIHLRSSRHQEMD